MATLRIEGGRRLEGRIAVEGNKNAALPLLAACLLTDQECVLTNVPRIRDVEVLIDLLVGLGATVHGRGTSTLRVRCATVTSDRPDPALVGRLRGSVLLLGPLLARKGSARLAPPGGDFPARRTISTHLQALAAMGAVSLEEPGHALDAPWGLSGASVYLDEASVTGTETALLAAAAAKGRSEIRHAATEPHVAELCRFLRALGVSIEGEGTSTIRVEAPTRFTGATHHLDGDYIEAGSWGVVAAITGGSIEVDRRALDRHGGRQRAAQEDGAEMLVRGPEVHRRAANGVDGRPPYHDRFVARLSERHGQPGDGPRDAGGGRDAGSRLDVRIAPLRARAAERDACRSVSLRSAPHHRQRRNEAEGQAPRYERYPLGYGLDCRCAGSGRGE